MTIKVKNLSIGYDQVLIDSIDFKLDKGNLVALIGKNGSGKSTLIKTLAGIIPAMAGKIFLDNRILNSKEIASKISVVLTDKPIPDLKVEEILRLGRLPYSDFLNRLDDKGTKIMQRVVGELNLQDLLEKKIVHLSDGEKQMVMIARALIQDTPVIILDEPTTHLDLENKATVLRLLKDLAKKNGKLVLFSTHDLNLVLPVIDKAIIINKFVCVPENGIELAIELKKLFSSNHLEFDEKEFRFKMN